jgi:hypothetical protein
MRFWWSLVGACCTSEAYARFVNGWCRVMKFTSDDEMRKISNLAQEFFERVLYDEKPLFVGDEATIWDVSMSTPAELLMRCSRYYGKPVSLDDLKLPLWKLLRLLNEGRDSGTL